MYEKWKSRAFPYKIRTKCEHIFFTPREGGRMEETMQNEYELKKLMCDIGKRIYDRNMVGFRPSSEIKMHMRVYQKRPDVGAVVHAHPTFATSFAIAGIPLTQPIMPEAVIALGCVPIAEYGTPSTMEIPDNVEKYLPYYDAVLLESHGALTWSTDLTAA